VLCEGKPLTPHIYPSQNFSSKSLNVLTFYTLLGFLTSRLWLGCVSLSSIRKAVSGSFTAQKLSTLAAFIDPFPFAARN
jgi:hypothetical protein